MAVGRVFTGYIATSSSTPIVEVSERVDKKMSTNLRGRQQGGNDTAMANTSTANQNIKGVTTLPPRRISPRQADSSKNVGDFLQGPWIN